MAVFVKAFDVRQDTRVLDVGGNTFNWNLLRDLRPRLTFVNIAREHVGESVDPEHTVVIADGCDLPFSNRSFDIVFCNSVIEHVGSKERQVKMAAEISRVGKSYFVQTPNYWFPIEPHYLAPGLQFLPVGARAIASMWLTPWGWLTRPNRAAARAFAEEIRLLSHQEMVEFFSDGDVVSERLAGFSKSWIAMRR